MTLLQEIRKRARQGAPQALLALILAYFAYHAIQGDRGILSWIRLQDELSRATVQYNQLAVERDRLEHKVNMLRSEHLDPDLLEERARVLLNYGHQDDYVIILERPAEALETDN